MLFFSKKLSCIQSVLQKLSCYGNTSCKRASLTSTLCILKNQIDQHNSDISSRKPACLLPEEFQRPVLYYQSVIEF